MREAPPKSWNAVAGVRALVVAVKYRNGYGAKGRRKVETQGIDDGKET